jgi:FkbM family methyltransferase
LKIPDTASFLSAYHEIFVNRIYDFAPSSSRPYIIDLGANIGLSVLYFKSLCPNAEICALEADPNIFDYLQHNIVDNGYTDVTILNKAAWHEYSTVRFLVDGADGGRISAESSTGTVNVEAIDVATLIEGRHVDFLKMDIEGAEVAVLSRCRHMLDNVDHVFVEFHSKEQNRQQLSILLEIFESNGFRYHIHSVHQSPTPFQGVSTLSGYDMLLNVFAWKEKS